MEKMVAKIPKKQFNEVIKSISEASSVDEVISIAKGYGADLSKEEAELALHTYAEEIELTTDYLDMVSGGCYG